MRVRSDWGWVALWGVLVALALAVRPLLPIDETRYLSVAWEMWQRDDWLVPYLNGSPYSDKPPLLFWGMLLGWRIVGVQAWWPRLLPPLCGLISVFLLARLARRLSPQHPDAADFVMPFLSGILWVTYSTVVLFDTLLTTCVLIALCGVVEAWRGRPGLGWLAYGIGIGLGALAKGPVVLVYVLPVALLAPWWGTTSRPVRWRLWYVGVLAGLVLGASLGLVWAVAAGARAGSAYQTAILWTQSAGRVTHAFAHGRPWWWYLPLLPVIVFPWAAWPPLWRSFADKRGGQLAVPTRFAIAYLVPAMIVLSVISSKQVHYLIPLLPVFAILTGFTYAQVESAVTGWDIVVPSSLLAIGGVLLLVSSDLFRVLRMPEWVPLVSPGWGLILLIGAFLLGTQRGKRQQLVALSLVSPLLLIVLHLAGWKAMTQVYDLRPTASFLKEAERARLPVAYVGHYAGQFDFLGRLDRPLTEVPPDQLSQWAADHPRGLVIRYVRPGTVPAGALVVQPYRDGVIGVWKAERRATLSERQMPIQSFERVGSTSW